MMVAIGGVKGLRAPMWPLALVCWVTCYGLPMVCFGTTEATMGAGCGYVDACAVLRGFFGMVALTVVVGCVGFAVTVDAGFGALVIRKGK
jgi:hypothetical protein